ncbi:MAG: ChbG/HpnK family deacetylase [Rubrivivax sp.]|nr:ChbG/HpnK family deacetylase [Rubrivivax sp.]
MDDFGLHEGVNHAVLRLAAMGRVQAIGCMVGGAAWPGGAAALRQLDADTVDLGLHLDLTETPLQPGTARPLGRWIRDSLLRRVDRRALRAEIRAQLDAFEQAVGRAPAYVDGHQHVHQFAGVRDELLAELDARHREARPWLRSTRRPRPAAHLGGSAGLKPWVIEQLGCAGLASLAKARGYPQNRHLLGVYDFQGDATAYARRLAAWLQAAEPGDLLMCHPGVPTEAVDALASARSAEFEVLSGAGFETQLQHARIVLRPMSRILRAAASARS